jgi:hypothetical protein
MIKFFLFIYFSVSIFASSLNIVDLGFLASKQIHKTFVFSSAIDKNIKVVFNSTPLDYYALFQTVIKSNNYKLISEKTFVYVDVIVSKIDKNSFSQSSDNLSLPPNLFLPHDHTVDPNPLRPDSSISVTNNGKSIYNHAFKNSFDLKNEKSVFDENISFFSFKFFYISPTDIENTLKFSGFDYSISQNSKTIFFKVPQKKQKLFDAFIIFLKSLDIERKQVVIKFTVFDSTDSFIRDIGMQSSLNLDSNLSIDASKFVKTLGSIFTGKFVASFYSQLHLSQIDGKTTISDNPTFLVSDNEPLHFDSVVNMPFLDTDFAFSAVQGTSQSKKYKYMPIGFKIVCTPSIVKDSIYLDLVLTYGSIVSGGDLPVTSEKTLKNRFVVHRGDLVLLAGISKDTFITSNDSVPFFSSIPYLGKLFNHDSKNKSNEKLNIAIEVN